MSYTRPQTEIDRMVEMRLNGDTLQQIGDRFDLTRERIRQILADEGITGRPWTGYKPKHYRRLAATLATVARLIVQQAKPDDDHFPHGTVNGYARGCSCQRCRDANRERIYSYRGITVKRPNLDTRVARTDGTRRARTYYGRGE